ncbi:glycine betaine ABC transporter substrate-binding protein [Bacillus paranthracis]
MKKVLNKLSGKITDEEMRKMNYEVNVNGKSSEEVAKQFLQKREFTSLNLQKIYKFICMK